MNTSFQASSMTWQLGEPDPTCPIMKFKSQHQQFEKHIGACACISKTPTG